MKRAHEYDYSTVLVAIMLKVIHNEVLDIQEFASEMGYTTSSVYRLIRKLNLILELRGEDFRLVHVDTFKYAPKKVNIETELKEEK